MKYKWDDDWILKYYNQENTTKELYKKYIELHRDKPSYDTFKWYVRTSLGLSKKKFKMSKEQEHFIRENFYLMSCEMLRKSFNKKFGTEFKVTAFHYHTQQLGLKKWNEHVYTAREDAFLRANAPKMTKDELTELFNKTFNCNVKKCAIEMRCWLKKYPAQSDGKFKENSVPWEKTKGGREEFVKKLKGGNSTSFKKGHGEIPIGGETERKETILVKTENGWKDKKKVVWEKEHGKISTDTHIITVDGNKKNCSIENLRAIDNYTQTILMSNRWMHSGAEIIDTAIKYAELKKILNHKQNRMVNQV